MSKILDGETLSATATAQTYLLKTATVAYSLVNDGDAALFYRSLGRPSATTATGAWRSAEGGSGR